MNIKAKKYLEKSCGELTVGSAVLATRQSEDVTQTPFAKMDTIKS